MGGSYGPTVGAKTAKVRVASRDRKQLGYLRVAARYLVSGLSSIVCALGYLLMLRDRKTDLA